MGFDGSEDATSALTWAARAARAMGSTLCIVHAVGLLEHAGMAGRPLDGAAAVRLAEDAGLDPGCVEWRVVDGDPCSALLRVAEGPDPAVLIVVGSRGEGRHAGTLLGSTSLELAEHAGYRSPSCRAGRATQARSTLRGAPRRRQGVGDTMQRCPGGGPRTCRGARARGSARWSRSRC